jgi:hypothetical protein
VAEKRVAGSSSSVSRRAGHARGRLISVYYLHGARCMFSSGQFTLELPYVIRSRREREAARGAGLACPASS